MTIKGWLFYITAKDETDIYGKQHRVRIAKLANEEKILGSVRNIKSKAKIEVKVVEQDEDKVRTFKDKIDQVLNEGKTLEFTQLFQFEDGDGKFTEFQLIREDELTEMVWALQGAGDVFFRSSQEIMKMMSQRDLKRERGLLGALAIELGYTNNTLDEMVKQVSQTGSSKFDFKLHCLTKALVEPPWTDDDFMSITHELFYSLTRTNKPNFESLDREGKLKELEAIKLLIVDYSSKLSKRLEDLK